MMFIQTTHVENGLLIPFPIQDSWVKTWSPSGISASRLPFPLDAQFVGAVFL